MDKGIIDPDLGLIEYEEMEEFNSNSYILKRKFPKSNKFSHFYFETDSFKNLPTKSQKDFYFNFLENYEIYLHSIKNNFSTILQNSRVKSENLHEEFELSTVGIPLNTASNPKWNISLISRNDNAINLLANFEAEKPVKVWIETNSKPSLLSIFFKKFIGRK